MSKGTEYSVLLRPMTDAEGGGWLATVPDLPGCMSDGDNSAEALANVQDAIEAWKEAAEELGRQVPRPDSSLGQWRQRVPKGLHAELKEAAAREGVSLNAFVTAVLAKSLGQRSSAP